jgi:hypothetical protein
MKSKNIGLGCLAGTSSALALIVACNALPAFGPVFGCLAGELANGALEDPMLLVEGCAGATIAALIQVIEIEMANLTSGGASSDASVVMAVTSSEGGAAVTTLAVPPSPSSAAVAYKAHLQRILDKAHAASSDKAHAASTSSGGGK